MLSAGCLRARAARSAAGQNDTRWPAASFVGLLAHNFQGQSDLSFMQARESPVDRPAWPTRLDGFNNSSGGLAKLCEI